MAPSLIYAPVFFPCYCLFHYWLLTSGCLGFRPSGARDDHFCLAHHTATLHNEAQALHLHIRESYNSKITIWPKGTPNTPLQPDKTRRCLEQNRSLSSSFSFCSSIASTVSTVFRLSWAKPNQARSRATYTFVAKQLLTTSQLRYA